MKMNHTMKAVALSLICAMFLTSCGGCKEDKQPEPPAQVEDEQQPAATVTPAPAEGQSEDKDPNKNVKMLGH